MEEALLDFTKQFSYVPEIKNKEKLGEYKHFVVGGMGGSNHASGILKMLQPGVEVYTHRDYGTPPFDEAFNKETLFIASSHSGNTEETVDFLMEAHSRGYAVAVITTGGELLDFAQKNELPYIDMPADGIQPRVAIAYSLIAIAAFVGIDTGIQTLENIMNPEVIQKAGVELASELGDKIPVIYTSRRNFNIGYNWKIKLNETGKIPAFYNIFSELNHNEMQGFDLSGSYEKYAQNFHFIFLEDEDDHEKIASRMDITEKLYQDRGLQVTRLKLTGSSRIEKIFTTLLMADWVAVTIARNNDRDPEEVPMIEEFKKELRL